MLSAESLGISKDALDLYRASDVIDLHIDTFIWTRIFGYDLRKKHGRGLLGARFFGQVDLPRIREAEIKGGIWVITTNPLPTKERRANAFTKNLAKLTSILESVPNEAILVRTASDYRRAREKGLHAAWLGIQGGNALDRDEQALDLAGDSIVRITLVHLSSSSLGTTSSPLRGSSARGLTDLGRDYVKRLNQKKIFVDLAHISRKGFFDAVEVHDPSQPLIVTHTGVSGVHPHWRNLDDDQIRAIAKTGGTIGVMYQASFLGDPFFSGRAETVVRHLEHIIRVTGEDHASLGSDWDGMIVPPTDLATCSELPKLVQFMLERKWSDTRIQKVLGGNFLRALAMIRP